MADNEILKIKRQTSTPYYSASMEINRAGVKKARNGARFDFYIIGKSGSTWYNTRSLLEIRNKDKTMNITSPKQEYELIIRYTSSISAR